MHTIITASRFQSTPPRRRRQRIMPQKQRQSKFQSTPPRRRRLLYKLWYKLNPLFQSTPPRRRRLFSCLPPILLRFISIHASAKEATTRCGTRYISQQFQSTPPRRRRRKSNGWQTSTGKISIHASAKEAPATYCDTLAIMYISSLNNFFVRYF